MPVHLINIKFDSTYLRKKCIVVARTPDFNAGEDGLLYMDFSSILRFMNVKFLSISKLHNSVVELFDDFKRNVYRRMMRSIHKEL